MTGSETGRPEDPWRLAEWQELPDVCFIAGCDSLGTDERGPVFLQDGSIHKACTEHWEPIFRVLAEQVSWEKEAMTKCDNTSTHSPD